MIPNNQSSRFTSGSGGRAPLPLDHYKNNLLKAKTCEENKVVEEASSAVSAAYRMATRSVSLWLLCLALTLKTLYLLCNP